MGSRTPVLKIRADGGPDIGLGHVVRCISLAHMLKNDFSILFYAIEIPDSLKHEIILNGWDVKVIEKEADFLKGLTENEIVVLDGYQFDSDYQIQIKGKGCKLVCIDDFHNQHFYADLVINHAPGLNKEDYDGEPYTKYLLGPGYALLRPEFFEMKSSVKKDFSAGVKNIFICFGGSDAKNLTAKVLSWLPKKSYSVTVVLGDAYNHNDELNKAINERQDLEIFVKKALSAKEMKQELEHADLAVAPASGILFEVVSQRVPVLSGYYVENQQGIYKGFISMGVFMDAKNFDNADFLVAIQKADTEMLNLIRKNQSRAIDRLSGNRIQQAFNKLKSVCV